jgi:putative ABC transport system permease protein
MFGAMADGLVAPTVPPALLVGLAIAALALTMAASLAPSRRATRVSPIMALAVE